MFQISAAAVLTAVVKALVPSEQYEKQFKILISCFFIAVAANALSSLGPLSDIFDVIGTDAAYNDYTVQVKEQTAGEIASALRTRISDELRKKNIFPEKIYIDVNILGETNISISEVRLVFKKGTSEEEMQRAVSVTRDLTGNEIKVFSEELGGRND